MPDRRVRRFEDCLALVEHLWSDEAVTFESSYCRLDNVRMGIRPVQRPRPPIWFAANNDAAIRRAARLGDNWFINPHATVATIQRQLGVFREERELAGKPVPVVQPAIKEVFCAKDRATALELAGPYLAAKYADYAKWGQDKALPNGESFNQRFETLLEDRFALGSPEEVFEQLRPYWEKLGVNHLVIRTHWAGMPLPVALSSMRLISDELIPALRKV